MGVSCTQKKVNAVVVPCIIPPEEKKGTSEIKEEKVVQIEYKASEHYQPILAKLLTMQNCIKHKHIIKHII